MQNLISYILLIFMFSGFSGTAQKSFEVEVSGNGQPILLFPGFTSTAEVFDGVREELSQRYEVHAFTFAGFGDVPPIDFPWLPTIKEDLVRYIQDHDLNQAYLVGHSLGGTLGLWLAVDYPDLAGVIVIDALPATGAMMFPGFDPEKITYDLPELKMMLEMGEGDFRAMAHGTAAGMTQNAEKHDQLARWIIQADRETYVYGYADFLKLDLRSELERIKAPVTVLAATQPHGKEQVSAVYNEQYQNLKNKKIIYAEDSAHFIMYDQPEWFARQLHAALQRNAE